MAANDRQVGGNHYRKQGIQHWDYVLANDIPYMEAQIIKYVSRWRDKGGIEDLKKASHFLDKLIEHNTKLVPDNTDGTWHFTRGMNEFTPVPDGATGWWECKACRGRVRATTPAAASEAHPTCTPATLPRD
jgi:hypothetical protein